MYYHFNYESDSDTWGYRFFVIGLSGVEWSSERDILSSPSLEWSLWTLNILLCQAGLMNLLHHDIKLEIYNALIEYLKTPAPFKSRIIHILTLLFRNPKFFDEIPAIQAIEELSSQAFNTINDNNNQDKSNDLLKSIIELYCVAKYKVTSTHLIQISPAIFNKTVSLEMIPMFYSVLQNYHLEHKIPIKFLQFILVTDHFIKTFESSHPLSNTGNNNIITYIYENESLKDFIIVIDPRTDIGNGYIRFYGNNSRDNYQEFTQRRNGRNAANQIYEFKFNDVSKITIEFKASNILTSSNSNNNKFGFLLSVVPSVSNTVDIEFLNKISEEKKDLLNDLSLAIENPKTIEYLMSINNDYKEQYPNYNVIEAPDQLYDLYNKYVNDYGNKDIPNWEIFRCLITTASSFGEYMLEILKFIDLSQLNIKGSFADLIQENKQLIHPKIKNLYIQKHLLQLRRSNYIPRRQYITIDRHLANRSQERGIIKALESKCVFKQIYDQLNNYGENIWCVVSDEEYVYKVSFSGESAIDAGGPYRESLHQMVEDLFSDHFDLFIPTSNNKYKHGLDSDCYVPNPEYNNNELTYLNMYEFVGRVMGYSIRSHSLLPFTFPKCIWNLLSGSELEYEDISDLDLHLYQNLEAIKNAKNAEEIPKQQAFIITNENGEVINLNPESEEESITMLNRDKHCELIINYIKHHYDIQMKSILSGLYSVVPNTYLFLLNGNELEMCVSGKPEVDIEYLKEHTSYSGYRKDDLVIKNFWKLMESFSHEERRKFIRFAWGRSRLPLKGSHWTNEFQIIRAAQNECNYIPIAHTCFFQIELPNYPSYEILEEKIRLAITYGLGAMMLA